MVNEKSVLEIIPFQGGKKEVSHKNIRDSAGRPSIAWSSKAAKKSKYLDRLILSFADNSCVSPSELEQDDTAGIDSALHAKESLPEMNDSIVCIGNPFLNKDIVVFIRLIEHSADIGNEKNLLNLEKRVNLIRRCKK